MNKLYTEEQVINILEDRIKFDYDGEYSNGTPDSEMKLDDAKLDAKKYLEVMEVPMIYTQPDNVQEVILCSAIMYHNILICGKRHEDCYNTVRKLTKLCGWTIIDEPQREDQGFLTSFNRFVDRKLAWKIAIANSQVKYGLIASTAENDEDNTLISENLY